MNNIVRNLGLALAGAVWLIIGNPVPAAAQTGVFGAYCGQITWEGRPPIDTWLLMLRENRWSSGLAGALPEADTGNNPRTQNGNNLIMRSENPPHYVMDTMISDNRITGSITSDRGDRGAVSFTAMRGTGAGLSSSPIPPDFIAARAESALNGSWSDLSDAVTWGWTPQGAAYWRDISNNGPPLPPEAAAALRDWIRRARAGERPRCAR